MDLIEAVFKYTVQAKDQFKDLYGQPKIEDPPTLSRKETDLLLSSLKISAHAPLIIESYIILYSIYIIYTILKTIVLAPIELGLSLFHISIRYFKSMTTRYVTFHSVVIIAVTYVFTLNLDLFDISFIYHLIRGQSTVKVYAIIFALESAQIVFTKVGVFLHKNIKEKLNNQDTAFYQLSRQFIIQFLYVILHAYSIYIEFLINIVILNSSLESFVIFWSVIYLTRMKNTPAFTVNLQKYKQFLSCDSKYRVSRIIYLFLFYITEPQIQIPGITFKMVFLLFFEEGFILAKHMLYLISSYENIKYQNAINIRKEMFQIMYLGDESTSLDRCIQQNFTVLPFAVFCIKILHVMISSNWEPSMLAYLTFYVILIVLVGIFKLSINVIKFLEKWAQSKKHQRVELNIVLNALRRFMSEIIQDTQHHNHNSKHSIDPMRFVQSLTQLSKIKKKEDQQKQDSKNKEQTVLQIKISKNKKGKKNKTHENKQLNER